MDPERCEECGFDGTRLTVADAIAALRTMGPRWRRAFGDLPDERLRRRPRPGVWSPLEYAAHTRDIISDMALEMSLTLEGRHPGPNDQWSDDEPDVRGVEASSLLDAIAREADALADRAAGVPHEALERTLGPDRPDAGWLLRHAVHDASHHLRDVERDLGSDE